jgi:hypothetical protein
MNAIKPTTTRTGKTNVFIVEEKTCVVEFDCSWFGLLMSLILWAISKSAEIIAGRLQSKPSKVRL